MSKKMITFCDVNGLEHDFPIDSVDYGTCSTSIMTSQKDVVCEGFSLYTGALIVVKFSSRNDISPITMNVNNTGAKTVYFPDADGGMSTESENYIQIGGCYLFAYDGTYWRFCGSPNVLHNDLQLYLNGSLKTFNGSQDQSLHWYAPTDEGSAGQVVRWDDDYSEAVWGDIKEAFYGTCSTTGSTSAKVVTCEGFSLYTGAMITVKFSYANTASSMTMNVNGTGAKTVYFPGTTSMSTTATGHIQANGCYLFVYDGTYWRFCGSSNRLNYGLTLSLNGSSSTFNGSSAVSKSWYAPTTAGTAGQVLKSNGSGAPTWGDADTVNVINNLTSTSSSDALSANQGNVLANYIADILDNTRLIQDSSGGFAAGRGAEVGFSGAAIGKNARTHSGGAVGADAISGTGFAGGCNAEAVSTGVALGYYASVSGDEGVAIGYNSTTSGDYSVQIGGRYNEASGEYSFCAGRGNKTLDYQTKFGQYAKDGTAGSIGSTQGDVFILGNGTSTNRSNAFRVTYAGKVYGRSSYSSSGADYAEYFEWSDGNPNDEDRRGRIVTLDGEKIRFATADDMYILGVISANPCVEGDVFSDDWQGKYLTDAFGARVTQVVHVDAIYEDVESVDPETGETVIEQVKIEDEHDAVQWVLNPDYDPDQEYVSREERKEWAAVGSMGKLVVVDDGTCVVGKYCRPSENGIGTHSENDGYRVMSRIDDTHVKVWVR